MKFVSEFCMIRAVRASRIVCYKVLPSKSDYIFFVPSCAVDLSLMQGFMIGLFLWQNPDDDGSEDDG